MWETAFIAMSVAIGETLDDAQAALGESASRAAPLIQALRDESREKRARAIAQHLAPIAADIDAMELPWPV